VRKRPTYVVPLETSREMDGTIVAAVALAKHGGATVDLLEIVPPQRPSHLDEYRRHRSPRTADMDIRTRAKAVRREGHHSSGIRTVSHPGKAAEIIPSYAQLEGAALIIVGKHYGTPKWRRSATFVSSLSRSAPVPVLVLPTGFRPAKTSLAFQRIVSAVDFTVASAVAVRTVIDMARRTHASVTLVHALNAAARRSVASASHGLELARRVRGEAVAVAKRLRRKLPSSCQLKVDARVEPGGADRAILGVAAEVDADLIVMGVPPRGRLDEVVFGSTLRQVLRRAKVPVLVVPVPAGEQRWLDDGEVSSDIAPRRKQRASALDDVSEAAIDSFPASDPPAWSSLRIGPPAIR